MRKLIFVKGPPGSGKSTVIENLGWGPYSLSKDMIRGIRGAPELMMSGKIGISQEENHSVEKEFLSLTARRMEKGEFLVLESLFDDYPETVMDLARLNRYDCAVLDLSKQDLSVIKSQNESRPFFRQVSSSAVEKVHRKMASQPDWENITTFHFDPTLSHLKAVQSWARHPTLFLDAYEKIVHIGDLQGCLSVLLHKDGPLENGQFNPKKAYIFVGDFVDRGIENGILVKWLLDNAVDKDNVFFVWGNHEDHLHRFSKNLPSVSEEFEENTLPQLLAAGITPEDADKICQKAKEAIFYEYHGQRVMVTHAGLPTVPPRPELISLKQYSKGTGRWSDPIDEQFERNAPSDWVQVHGHRNHGWQEIQATPRSFSLEDQVEFGGFLRFCVLDKNGWKTSSVKNAFYSLTDARKIEKKKIKWSSPGVTLAAQSAQKLHDHAEVNEKQQAEDHIVSFNFSKNVFFNASWDDVVVKARGFFINKKTNEIVARGYDKFFNINERPETELAALAGSLHFPVIGYVKENGFLGNIGYDAETQSLFVATKSSSSGDFSDWFRAILDNKFTKTKQEGLARYLRDNEACLTFEVIDPKNDPHMIRYENPQLILLDVFHRNEETERLSYEDLKIFAKKFGFDVKARGIVLHDAMALQKWHDNVCKDLRWQYHGKDLEGFVFEDQKGFMTKIKLPYYAFWKKMRSSKDRMAREWKKEFETIDQKNQKIQHLRDNHGSQAPLIDEVALAKAFVARWDSMQDAHPLAQRFMSWCVRQGPSAWGKSIIDLRDDFLKETPVDDLMAVPFEQYNSKTVSKQPPKP